MWATLKRVSSGMDDAQFSAYAAELADILKWVRQEKRRRQLRRSVQQEKHRFRQAALN